MFLNMLICLDVDLPVPQCGDEMPVNLR